MRWLLLDSKDEPTPLLVVLAAMLHLFLTGVGWVIFFVFLASVVWVPMNFLTWYGDNLDYGLGVFLLLIFLGIIGFAFVLTFAASLINRKKPFTKR